MYTYYSEAKSNGHSSPPPPNCPSIVDFCTEESHVCTYMAEDGAFYTCFILDERHIA